MRYAIAPLLFSLVCISSAAVADEDGPVVPPVTYPALARHASTAEAFVPAGWRIESQKSGDLNGDGRSDVVLVLRDADPHNVVDARERGGPQNYDTNPRIIVVAFAAAAGG